MQARKKTEQVLPSSIRKEGQKVSSQKSKEPESKKNSKQESLIKCPKCHHTLSKSASTCPDCGHPIGVIGWITGSKLVLLAITIAGITGISVTDVFSIFGSKDKNNAKQSKHHKKDSDKNAKGTSTTSIATSMTNPSTDTSKPKDTTDVSTPKPEIVKVPCPNCNVRGRVKCTNCDATGKEECSKCRGRGQIGYGRDSKACPQCRNGKKECHKCKGSGYIPCRRCNETGLVDSFR